MAFGHGTGISLTIGGTDVTDYITSYNPAFETAMAELRTLGNKRVQRLPGHADATATLEGSFEPALDTILWTAYNTGASVSVIYGPQGSGAGAVRFTVPFYVSRYSPGPASADAVQCSAELVGTGADITKDTF